MLCAEWVRRYPICSVVRPCKDFNVPSDGAEPAD